jgi:MATE family multidrug resistance protein
VSAPLVGLVDTWAIGQMPDTRNLAAIGMGVIVFNYIFWAFGFLRMGTTGLVAQENGRNDSSALTKVLLRSGCFALVIGSLLVLCQNFVWSVALIAIDPPGEVGATAYEYFGVMIWSAPAALFVYTISGALIGLERTKLLLFLQLVLNVLNAVLNVVFVVILDMGVAGVALGTLIAQCIAALCGVVILLQVLGAPIFLKEMCDRMTWRVKEFKHIVAVNGFIFFRTLLLLTAIASTVRISAAIGEAEMAATHVISQFVLLMALGLDGFANAVEAIVGSAWGKKDRALFSQWVRHTNICAFGASCLYAICFALFGNAFTAFLVEDEIIRMLVADIMPLLILMPLIAVWCFQYDGIYIGITATKAMFFTMVVAFVVYFSIVMFAVDRGGLFGLWSAYLVFLASRGLSQIVWLSHSVKRLDS